MQIIQKQIKDLKPYKNNAKLHPQSQVNQIAESIKEFGFNVPILIDSHDMIIAGHGRYFAAKKLKMETLPCILIDHLTEAQKRAFIIADNKLNLNTGFDMELLKSEFEAMQKEIDDLTLTGFTQEEIDMLFPENAESQNYLTDPDEIPETPETPVCRLGDIWQMEKNRLMCGDSTDEESMKTLCNGSIVDLWLTDPPYNIAYEGKTKDALTIQNDNMSDDKFLEFLTASYLAADSVMKSGAVFYIWHADSEGFNFRYATKKAKWKVRQCLVWSKSSMVLGRQDYQWKHEPCLYGWKEGGSHYWGSDRKQTTILSFDKPSRNGEHPTMKPVDLFEYQIKNSTKKNEIVLDSFAGSGTTLIAAEKTNRTCYGMELEPKYCDVIIKRWEEYTGKKAIHEETGKTFEELKAIREKS